MNDRVLATLEYNKIIDMLAARAVSPMGKEMCAALKPSSDINDITCAQRETTEAAALILKKGSLPLGGIQDIRSSLARSVAGGILDTETLLGVCDFLYVCRKVITYGRLDGGNEPSETKGGERLSSFFDVIGTADSLEAEINRCVISASEISDTASPKLGSLRREIKVANDRIREHMSGVIHSEKYKLMLQDAIITIRNDRFCVPVKAEYQGGFPGMVHDRSSSGSTLFMEPLSVVQLNNKIKELHFDEQKEIERILQKLSGLVAEQADLLGANLDVLTGLDFIFAKGELSLAMRAAEPEFNTERIINIRKGRHPLLASDSVVPTDIRLGEGFSMLLITGPNTGGKTVSLKMLGLFTCMGQAGLHIPAFDNSRLAVFDEVFADIGDEQSIEQSLSTFSSHMTNIVRILESVSGNALVLLDELGAGTDPTEGAALAVSILRHLQTLGVRCAVTTHYSELKLFALSTEGVENASCEFDVETLRPTYKLLIGIPGKSNAFAIAKRLGLSENIISQAKDVLSHEDVRFEDMITDLEISKKSVLMEQERAEQFRREAETLRGEFEKQKEKLNNQRDKLLKEAKDDAAQLVRRARDEADELFKEFRNKMRDNLSQRDLDDARRQMTEQLSNMESSFTPVTEKRVRNAPPPVLRRGDRVRIHSLEQTGTVSALPDGDGNVLIQAGIMKIRIHISDLSLDDTEEKEKKKLYAASQTARAGKSMSIKPEVDLRGMSTEEALEAAEKYLDDAYLAGLESVRIIHGKGTGALRRAIHIMLKRMSHVTEYRLGKYGEGEDGVTVASLKKT